MYTKNLYFLLLLTVPTMKKFQSATKLHHKKTTQEGSGAQQSTLLSSLWNGLFIIISVLTIIAALKNTLIW